MSTITTINAGDNVADSRAVINTNFSNLNTDKVESLADLGITTATAANIEKTQYLSNVTSDVQAQIDSAGVIPPGAVFPYAAASAPTGYLLCYGQAVSRETYSDLFTVISTTYGVGDGSTTFNVPDLRGRVVAALDNLGGSSANIVTDADADTLGGTDGEEDHTLTVDEMPAHTHTIEISDGGDLGFADQASGSSMNGESGSTGGGSAHNTMQPTIFMSYIIKT